MKQTETETDSSIRSLPFPDGTAMVSMEGTDGWMTGTCPVCSYERADIDPQGILWCPACGYSKKGCYT